MYNLTVHEWYVNGEWVTRFLKEIINQSINHILSYLIMWSSSLISHLISSLISHLISSLISHLISSLISSHLISSHLKSHLILSYIFISRKCWKLNIKYRKLLFYQRSDIQRKGVSKIPNSWQCHWQFYSWVKGCNWVNLISNMRPTLSQFTVQKPTSMVYFGTEVIGKS